jgi:prevent-host-death family protein
MYNLYMIQVSVSDARRDLPTLLRRAQEGEHIVLTNRGRVVAQIAPVNGPRAAGSAVEARRLDWLRRGRIVQLGREGSLLDRGWRPRRRGGLLAQQILKDRR